MTKRPLTIAPVRPFHPPPRLVAGFGLKGLNPTPASGEGFTPLRIPPVRQRRIWRITFVIAVTMLSENGARCQEKSKNAAMVRAAATRSGIGENGEYC